MFADFNESPASNQIYHAITTGTIPHSQRAYIQQQPIATYTMINHTNLLPINATFHQYQCHPHHHHQAQTQTHLPPKRSQSYAQFQSIPQPQSQPPLYISSSSTNRQYSHPHPQQTTRGIMPAPPTQMYMKQIDFIPNLQIPPPNIMPGPAPAPAPTPRSNGAQQPPPGMTMNMNTSFKVNPNPIISTINNVNHEPVNHYHYHFHNPTETQHTAHYTSSSHQQAQRPQHSSSSSRHHSHTRGHGHGRSHHQQKRSQSHHSTVPMQLPKELTPGMSSASSDNLRMTEPEYEQMLKGVLANKGRCSFPTGNKSVDRYIGLKRIGEGTFADIWEVYDQFDPNRKHYAMKVLKRNKCCDHGQKHGHGTIDKQKYIKYTSAMKAEGNRIIRLSRQEKRKKALIIECKEILDPFDRPLMRNMDMDSVKVLQHAYPNNIGPCVVLELMGISLLQHSQLCKLKKLTMSVTTIRYISIQLFAALSFLHGFGGYIHADLKPENVLITLEHSINNNLENNPYPNIKIVDLGNALSYNRRINTFEVQSLYYRAPEVFLGHSMSAAIDMWSVGCILFELLQLSQFVTRIHQKNRRKKDSRESRHHHALFASRNGVELAKKILLSLSRYPCYVYNEWTSCYFTRISQQIMTETEVSFFGHQMINYQDLKTQRIQSLMKLIDIDEHFKVDSEIYDFLDMVSGLLDLNPSTRLTSEDAIQHDFCIDLKYISGEDEVINCLENVFESAYPKISISTDEERQYRINKQMEEFKTFEFGKVHHPNSLPRPNEMAITQKNAPHIVYNEEIRTHNKVYCLLNNCCSEGSNNSSNSSSSRQRIVKRETISGTPPLKKMRLSPST